MMQDPNMLYLEARRKQAERTAAAAQSRMARDFNKRGAARLAAAATLRWLADRVDTNPRPASLPVRQGNL